MARAGWVKPKSDRRLSDLVSVGLLTRVFPPDVVDEVIAEAGRTEQRHRLLPARTMACFAVGMALHSDGSYEDVLALMTDGLAWAEGEDEPVGLASKSAIFQARERLGAEPLKALFTRVAHPLAIETTPGSWLAGRRLVAIDGTTLDVADTDVNDNYFGRPGVNKGERSAFPQARLVALAECGTHAIFDAEIGPYATSEVALSKLLVDRLDANMVLLADRGFTGFDLWQQASATGADLVWRAKSNVKPRRVEALADGSWLAEMRLNNSRLNTEHVVIRVVEYHVDDGRGTEMGPFRLFTTLLDPDEVTATELADVYRQRWEIESVRGTQNPSTRLEGGTALEVASTRRTRDLGPSVLPLRDPHPHVRSRRHRQPGPRPGQLHRRTTNQSPLAVTSARFSPLRELTITAGAERSYCCSNGSTRPDATEPAPDSSNASTPSGTSNEPPTMTGHNPPDHPPRSSTPPN